MAPRVFYVFFLNAGLLVSSVEGVFVFPLLRLLWVVAAVLGGFVFQVIHWDLGGGDVVVVEVGRGVGLRVRLERCGCES